MRRLLSFSTIIMITITLAACGDSSTGPDSDDDEGNSDPTTYRLSVDMSPSDAGSVSDLEDSYEEGDDVEVQANPNDEYVFTGWSGDVESEENPLSVTMDQDYDLAANFELKEYQLTINKEGKGSVNEEVVEEKSKEYEHGTVVELTANPSEGYRFVEWSGDVENSDNPIQITVDDPKEVTAVFEKKSYPLTVTTEGDGAVSEEVIRQKTTDYEYGAVVELTATPSEGSDFAEWSGDVTGTDNSEEVTVEDTMEVTATFKKQTFTVSTSKTGEGDLGLDPDEDEYEYDSTVEITATPEEGWEFSEWGDHASGTENPLTVTVTEDLDIIANFDEDFTYSLTTNTSGEGTISKDPDEQEYQEDAEVELTAGPDEGWNFAEWQGDVSASDNPLTITIDGDKEVTAIFEVQKEKFYLAENGATIKCKDAEVGDTGTVDGTEYTKRTAEDITPDNASTTCTSSITDMSELFRYEDTFNEDISHWDVSNVTDMRSMFLGAESFNQQIGHWDVSDVESMASMFADATSFNWDISNWDVSSVTIMSSMFRSAYAFNQDLNNWNVSSSTTMLSMFKGAESFNGDISEWDVSDVENMGSMFEGAENFNQQLGDWNVGNVTTMAGMFREATNFNGSVGKWDVSSVTSMQEMFRDADSFNQDINSWNVSSVSTMTGMFQYADNFNRDLNNWDLSSVDYISSIFKGAESFNGDLSDWDVNSVKRMSGMFWGAIKFNRNINNWDVSSVTNMGSMFRSAHSFNQNLSSWDVSDVSNMASMFLDAESFNEDISTWDVSNVADMSSMFSGAGDFNQDISGWCVTEISSEPSNFSRETSLSDEYHPFWGTCPE